MAEIILVGRNFEALERIKTLVHQQGQTQVRISTNMEDLRQVDMILTVTNAIETIIEPHHLKSGAVICDVARPRDVSRQVVDKRDDVLVIEGGMVGVPGQVNFNFDFGFPPGMAFACMAETITLALEGYYQSYTLGKGISLAQVEKMSKMAARHGFTVSGFRSFENAITDESIHQIRQRVHQKQLNSTGLIPKHELS